MSARHPLATLRTRAGGITQLELATRVGVTPGMVSQWERGGAVPRREIAGKVDDALGANGAALEAFGYMPPGTLKRIADLESETAALRQAVTEVQAWRVREAGMGGQGGAGAEGQFAP